MLGGGGGGGGGPGRGRGRGAHPRQTDDKPKSQLSAEAKEWFPPNYVAPVQQQENYYPHNYGRNNSHNYGYNYGGYQQQNNEYWRGGGGGGGGGGYGHGHGHGQQRYGRVETQTSLSQLTTMLDEVTFSPGRFTTLSGPLVDSFSQTLDDPQHTKPLVAAIVDQAVREPNFRYNGARLCTMFDIVESQSEAPSTFRSCLLERCNTEEVTITSASGFSIDRACGFAMFLAELYIQFENPEGGRIKALGESLCKILKRMLVTPDNNSTKAACQVLKLSGLALDADCKLHVDDIFVGLRESEAAGVQAPLVRNLLNLRQSRWGSGGFAELVDSDTTTAPAYQPPPPVQQQQHNGMRHNSGHHHNNRGGNNRHRGNGDNVVGMFYLPEGHALTLEEAAFLNQHLPPSGNNTCSDDEEVLEDSDNDNWEPGIDEEQQADFLEFLRSSNQIAR